MVGIQGLGGASEPRPERPATSRDRDTSATSSTGQPEDGLLISSAAQAAATLSSSIRAAEIVPDVRTDRVEAAREAIERGDFKQPEVVAEVAERISRLL